MKYILILDPDAEESVTVTAHAPSPLTDELEALVRRSSGLLAGITEDAVTLLQPSDIACITVLEGKTIAIDSAGVHYRLKQRLYELETSLPASFIRINKSALANLSHIARFSTTFSGAVDAVFRCGYREYVSRRCFAAIKRRYDV